MEDSAPKGKKVRDLFAGRQIDWLYAKSPLVHDPDFYRRMMDLQASIYELDLFLERSWIVDPKALESYWEQIHHCLAAFHYNHEDRERLLRDIRVYQTHELLTRTGGNPLTIPITEFYHYKTCDVRLIRQLMYLAEPRMQNIIPEDIWRYYDWLTEVQDDIDDQEEDRGTYNVNRYMHAMDQWGADQAKAAYLSYIRHIATAALETLRLEEFPLKTAYEELVRQAATEVKSRLAGVA